MLRSLPAVLISLFAAQSLAAAPQAKTQVVRQVVSKDAETGKGSALVELISIVPCTWTQQALHLDVPAGFTVTKFTATGPRQKLQHGRCKTRYHVLLAATTACSLDGKYKAHFKVTSSDGSKIDAHDPAAEFAFDLKSDDFCGDPQ